MEHTGKYLQAKWLTENPKGYDERDVARADSYCNAYLEGYNQALSIADVIQQRELLLAYNEEVNQCMVDSQDLLNESDVDEFIANNCG